jgi:hypothetical protein
MRALSAAIAPLLASLLLIASVIAPAHCLVQAAPAGDRPAELCQPASLFDPAPGPGQGANHLAGICLVSAGLGVAVPADPVAGLLEPHAWHEAAFLRPAARGPPVTGKPFSPANPRAPPAA